MRTRNPILVGAIVSLLIPASAFAQGTLTPPGPPAPTMKTLDQIEPRTPISTAGMSISAPGSYYLTTNLVGSGISIFADNVTIDLNGFAILGAGAGNGILVFSGKNLVLRNGTISGFGTGGVAINASGATGSVFENLRLFNNGGYGLEVGAGSTVLKSTFSSNYFSGVYGAGQNGVTVRNCSFDNNNSGGGSALVLGVGAVVEDCTFTTNKSSYGLNVGRGSRVKDCTLIGNNGTAMSLSDSCKIINCVLQTNGFHGIFAGNNCAIKDCTVELNAQTGITCGNNSTLSGCTVVSNNVAGIVTGSGGKVSDCTVNFSFAGSGIDVGSNSVVTGSVAQFNSLTGIVARTGCKIADCNVWQNLGAGIVAYEGSQISSCVVRSNGAAGIEVRTLGLFGSQSTVKNCTSSQNGGIGIRVFEGSTVQDCASAFNGDVGIDVSSSSGLGAGSLVSGCTAAYNKSHGIRVVFSTSVMGNNCNQNGFNGNSTGALPGYGIQIVGSGGNRIEGNHVVSNNRGIDAPGVSGNVIIRNTARGNVGTGTPSANYNIGAGNFVGTIVTTEAAMNAATNSNMNISF